MAMYPCLSLPSLSFPSVSGAVCSFDSQYAGIPLKSCQSAISGYQEGSGTPSPSNIRNLVSFSSGTLNKTGKNLFDLSKYLTDNNISYTRDGDWFIFNISSALYNNKFSIPLNYYSCTLILDNERTIATNVNLRVYKQGTAVVQGATLENKNIDSVGFNYSTTGQVCCKAQVELGSSATSYETYNGNIYTFTFGQDIYQGYIDWERGVVVGTHKIKSIDSSSPINHGEGTNVFYINDFFDMVDDTETTDCNYLIRAEQNYYTIANVQTYMEDKAFTCAILVNRLFIKNTDWSSLSDFLTWLGSGHIDIAIKLATPIEIPLGGIQLLTQEGQNNIWVDTGDTTLQYPKFG